jgi:phosphoribosylformylglycinamidine cyclo-ligase
MKNITYRSSGVDIDKAEQFIQAIKKDVRSTYNKNVLARTGAFGSLFSLKGNYKNPVIVSSTDGVGTKLLVANQIGKHDTVGIDLVAMNVNDILCVGAKPLFFLDYIACGKLKPQVLCDVMKGIAEGCRQAGCALIGGETAEMPGMYKDDDYDLAGFAVGIVENKKIIDGSGIKAGNKLIGLPSSGPHSNGYSLIRKVLTNNELKKYKKEILAPTRIYASEIAALTSKFDIKGIAHVTGGAFYDKVTKIVPKGYGFRIDKRSWEVPEIFRIIQKKGNIIDREMYRTFNMGLGIVAAVTAKEMPLIRNFLKKNKIIFYEIGEVIRSEKKMILES